MREHARAWPLIARRPRRPDALVSELLPIVAALNGTRDRKVRRRCRTRPPSSQRRRRPRSSRRRDRTCMPAGGRHPGCPISRSTIFGDPLGRRRADLHHDQRQRQTSLGTITALFSVLGAARPRDQPTCARRRPRPARTPREVRSRGAGRRGVAEPVAAPLRPADLAALCEDGLPPRRRALALGGRGPCRAWPRPAAEPAAPRRSRRQRGKLR